MYQTDRSSIGSRGFPSKPQNGNNRTTIINSNWDDKKSVKDGILNLGAHGSMDEDTQDQAENYMKVEMTGDMDGIIQDASTGSNYGGK